MDEHRDLIYPDRGMPEYLLLNKHYWPIKHNFLFLKDMDVIKNHIATKSASETVYDDKEDDTNTIIDV